ncbi:MAG: DUF624 domain-containing protein [Clostridia bacterium]|nr:DUF624 domain-containing protein [Bacteroidales bacterium]MBO5569672.1 DUF624 domain-containing protein [Clostridia bacterium]
MKRFFNPENGLWKIFGFIGDLLILSMLWTVCCAPIITAGAASCALYDAVTADFRRHEQDYLRRFFRTLKREFLSSLLPTLLWAAVLAGLWWLLRAFAGGSLWRTAIGLGVFLLPLGIVCWVFPLLSRFTLDFQTLCGNALRLALGHAPSTFAMGLGLALSVWLTLRLALLPLFFLPALLSLYLTLFLEPVFRQYESPPEE